MVAKCAMSVDGRIGCADGTSQWITGSAARAQAHRLRARSQAILHTDPNPDLDGLQAILIGSGTALADEPKLTARVEAMGALTEEESIEFNEQRVAEWDLATIHWTDFCFQASPLLRVVVDSRGRVTTGPLVDDIVTAPTLIFTSENVDPNTLELWASKVEL